MIRLLAVLCALAAASPAVAVEGDVFARFDDWAYRYRAADFALRQALLPEGRTLAQARRAELERLIENQPEAALRHAASRAGLPEDITSLLEQPLDGTGQWQVRGYFGHGAHPAVRWVFKLDGQSWDVAPFGALRHSKSLNALHARGIGLDGHAALWDPGEKAVSQQANTAASSWTVGNKKLRLIRVDFSDAPGDPMSTSAASSLCGQFDQYARAASYGKTSITCNVVQTTVRVPRTKAQYNSTDDTDGLLRDARAAASAAYPSLTGDLDVVAFTKMPGWDWAGLGFIGQSGVWLNAAFDLTTLAHECGHNFGLYHANFWRAGSETIIGAGQSIEYGNPFDIMGGGDGHYNAWYKWDLDWFGPTEVAVVTSSNSFRVYDLEQTITGGTHALKIPIGATRDYWVEFRPATGAENSRGVSINWGYPRSDSSDLLDMTPWTTTADDSPLVLGRTFSDFTSGIHITPTALVAGSMPAAIDVVVNRGQFPACAAVPTAGCNRGPAVTLNASATQVNPGQAVTLTAAGTDPDGDTLAYFWDFGDGSASTNAAMQTHSWTSAREVSVRVTASDMKGGQASASVLVRIGSPSTLRISGNVNESGTGVEGVRVYTGNRFTFTDSAGNYALTGLAAGSYAISAIKTGFTFTAAFTNPVALSSASVANINFSTSRSTYSIAGQVTSAGQPVAGASVSAGRYTTLTNSSGDYLLSGVPNGAYQMQVTAGPGQNFVPQGFTNPVTVSGANLTGKNFLEQVVPVSGKVTGQPGPHLVTDGVHSAMTSLNGGDWTYSLPKVPPGKWNLWASAPGQSLAPQFVNPVTVASTPVTGKDFVSTAGAGFAVTGFIDEAGGPLQNAAVDAGVASGATDSRGVYVLSPLPAGTFTLMPLKPGYLFGPATRDVTLPNPDGGAGDVVDFTVLNPNVAPLFAFPPHPTPNPVLGTTCQLTSLGYDPIEAESTLTYTWTQTFGVAPTTLGRANGLNSSKSMPVTFAKPGAYSFDVTVADLGGLSSTGQVTVLVLQTTTAVNVTPSTASVEVDADKQFVATLADQFNQPIDFGGDLVWTVTPSTGATVSATGKFNASVAGSYTVTAEADGKLGSAAVTVVVGPIPRVAQAATATPNPVTGTTTALTVLGSDDEGEPALTYTWAAVTPVAAVSFAPNGSNAAKASTATFTAPGSYNLKVDIADARNLKTTSFVTVMVDATLTAVSLTPASATLAHGAVQVFSAQGVDQFGAPVPGECTFSADLGSITANGSYTAPNSDGQATVTASCGGVTGTAAVTISGGGSGGSGKGCGCATDAGGASLWALLAAALWWSRSLRRSSTGALVASRLRELAGSRRWRALGLAALAGAGCTGNQTDPVRASGAPEQVMSVSQALGEPQGGYPSDQERMLHVLVNLARHSAKTPNNNQCGDHSASEGANVKKQPLTWVREANVGARFTSRHLSELGCYQHDNCCVLGDAGVGVGCLAPAECTGANCQKVCDAGVGQTSADRYRLFGFSSFSGESLAQNVGSAYDVWCNWMQSDSNRGGIYDDGGTQIGTGAFTQSGASCNGTYWTLAYGNAAVAPSAVPRVPAASAIYNPPNPFNTSELAFMANYFDPAGQGPRRSVVVVAGHCFDLERTYGFDDNGTYEARFPDPDVLPQGCHPYYFLFNEADGGRVAYPTVGSLQLALGQGVSCPVAYDPSAQLPADCETGVQQCPAGGEQSCYTADNATLRYGECRQGYQVCKTGFWSACKDMIGPFPETCDGLDNDCDGQVDEGDPNGGAGCTVLGERGVCQAGVKHCVSGRLQCVSTQGPQSELCDGVDNDCDGVIDDGFGLLTCGQGECFRTAPSCQGGRTGTCTPGTASAEIDDGKDNDCNGLVDDGIDCTGAGVTLRQVYPVPLVLPDGGVQTLTPPCKVGTQFCQADGGWGPVLGAKVPTTEVCNGLDDDCDGIFDNMAGALNQIGWARCGVGSCTTFTALCKADQPVTCTPGTPSPEVCNGLDDNCDGTVDEGCDCRAGDERGCYTGPSVTRDAGVCHSGVRTCVDGGYTSCQSQVVPSAELCNGLDDDCNGLVDDQCVSPPDSGQGGGAGGGGEGVGGGGDSDAGTGGGKGGCGCTSAPGLWWLLAPLLVRRRRAER